VFGSTRLVWPLLLLAGCVPALQTVDTPGSYLTTVLPAIGSTNEVDVGETMIDEKHALTLPAIRFSAPCQYSIKHDAVGTGTLHYSFEQSAMLDQMSTKNGVPAYCGMTNEELFGGVQMPICVATSSDKIVTFPGSDMIVKSDCKVTHITESINDSQSVRKEILYDGRSGSTIKLSYREFVHDLARPAFTQELTYDISSDRVVGFRGARFGILSAGNSGIRYKVLRGF
jgi:hypothetical protein